MFANSIKCSQIQKIFLILENVQKFVEVFMNLKNVCDFTYVHEVKKMFMISKKNHDFKKELRVIVYLGDAAKYGHAIGNYDIIFLPLHQTGPFASIYIQPVYSDNIRRITILITLPHCTLNASARHCLS